MKRKYYLAAALPMLAAMALVGCTDDKYDLSDIDSTVRVPVNDLVVPVNLDKATLSDIFDIKESDKIQEIDGQYSFIETGKFNSDPINIRPVVLAAPYIESTDAPCLLADDGMTYALQSPESSFSYHTDDVSDFIVSIDEAGAHWTITIDMKFTELQGSISGGRISELTLLIPKGLTLKDSSADYNPATGIYKATDIDFKGNHASIYIEAISFNAAQAGLKFEYASHTASLADNVRIVDGKMHITDAHLQGQAPAVVTLHTDYTMSEIHITEFSGEMKYTIDNASFSAVDLSDLPDFLSDKGTNIRLLNPQIYLDITNPLYTFGLNAQTGLDITSEWDNGYKEDHKLDAPGYFTINTSTSVENYRFCLSPTKPDKYYAGYDGAEYVKYSSLSDILYSEDAYGIPGKLAVEMTDPSIPVQRVRHLPLGRDLGSVEGNYTFYAPLSLGEGSVIVYSDVMDGWGSEDLDHLTISALSVTAEITSDLPLDAHIVGYPVDSEGRIIRYQDEQGAWHDVEIVGADVPAGAKDFPIEIKITGSITGLDGIRYVATVNAADPSVLTPGMSLKLQKVRAKVSGFYEKEL